MKISNLFYLFAALVVCACSSDLGGRVDQYADVPVPSPVTIASIRNISGGAVIKINIPDDEYLKGVVAYYERNGKEVNARISRYVDSLTVEGFADTDAHVVRIHSFNVNGELSDPVEATVNPLMPAIKSVGVNMVDTFGGVKIYLTGNESLSDLAVCLLKCDDLNDMGKPLKDMKWVEVTTMFTSSNDIRLTRRGLEPEEAIFGVYVRDHWGNISDTTTAVLTPLWEAKLDTVKTADGRNAYIFKDAHITDDNCTSTNASWYPVSALWDNSGLSEIPHFFVSEEGGPSPTWLTIDLGRNARLSRITTLPRIGYVIYGGGAVRDYEFWGSLAPTGKSVDPTEDNPYGFDETWFCLGKFTQAKPSGYLENGLPGTVTVEDRDTYNAGNDFELDRDVYPRCNDELRYLRVVFANTFNTFEFGHGTSNRQVQTGEVTPYGEPILD